VQQAQAKKDMGVAEEHFQIDLNPGDMFSPQIQGYIDVRISENAVEADHQQVVLDWKTNQATYEPTENNQLGLYAWAVSQQTGANAVLGILRFLRFKGKKGRKTKLFTQGDMEKARQWAMDRANDILARKSQLELGGDAEELFSANPKCGECKWCTVVKDCQAQSETKEDSITKAVTRLDKNEMVITSHSEAEEVGAELLRLQAVSKKLTAALKEYSQETGQNIVVGDQEYGKKDSVSWTFTADQKKEIAKALIQEGVNPWNIFKLGSTELNDKEIISIGWDEETFKNFGGEKSTRTNYKWAKASRAKKGGMNDKIKKGTEKAKAS